MQSSTGQRLLSGLAIASLGVLGTLTLVKIAREGEVCITEPRKPILYLEIALLGGASLYGIGTFFWAVKDAAAPEEGNSNGNLR